MVGLLVATVTFTLIVIVVVALLVAVTVVPAYIAVQMAETRRFSTTRWFGIASATIGLGLLGSYELHHHHHHVSRILVVLPLVLTWAAPAVLWLLEAGQVRLGGRAGAHE
jgi:hypothetical protein